jgi:DNA helicase-2/ATP-dependent DNA helicase PcrA
LRDFEAEAHAAGEPQTVAAFLERVTLQADVDQMKDAPRVTLMTVHSAKGLEFELVLLTGMEEEMFPYRGMNGDGRDDIEEERRLAYVAITRARRKLIVTHVQARQIFGTTRWGRPSRFLSDIPPDAIRHGATPALGVSHDRFIDRPSPSMRDAGMASWRHPQSAVARPNVAPGERYVDKEFFDDASDDGDGFALARGAKVFHDRFGEGEVRRVDHVGEPSVVAFFPGWGEKKILARYLKRA